MCLSALLQGHTPMQVVQAEDGTTVKANCVYVIPPGKHLTSVNWAFATHRPEAGKRKAGCDGFVFSLACRYARAACSAIDRLRRRGWRWRALLRSCELPSGAGAAHSNHDTRIYLRRERPRMGDLIKELRRLCKPAEPQGAELQEPSVSVFRSGCQDGFATTARF